MKYFLLDVGGTKLRWAMSRTGTRLDRVGMLPTPRTWRVALKAIQYIAKREQLATVRRVVVGLPGLIDRQRGTLIDAPNLRGWQGKSIARDLSQVMSVPVIIENDAALAGMGVARVGRDRSDGVVAYLTVSTGVGGARIVHGQIDQRAVGFEPGHQILLQAGRRVLTLEQLVSGSNIQRRFGRPPERLHSVRIWRQLAVELALGLVNVIELWSPTVIILGGGVMPKYAQHLPLIRATVRRHLVSSRQLPPIRRSQLGDTAGLWGGLIVAKTSHRRGRSS